MALSDTEIEWVNWVSGKGITRKSVRGERRDNRKKEEFLSEVMRAQLDDVRGEIDAAQSLVVTRSEDPNILTAAWRKITKSKAESTSEMKWRADDEDTNQSILSLYELRADVEVDTDADIDERTKNIPMEDLQALEQAFQRIKEMEKAMRLQFDSNGEPLFSDKDIREELWTPLVRSGLIPENMVPDQFSEHAIAFKGAQELYAEKIEAFSEQHSKTEQNLKLGLRVLKSTATMVGSVVSNANKIDKAGEMADEEKEIKTKKAKKIDLDNEKKAEDAKLKGLKADEDALSAKVGTPDDTDPAETQRLLAENQQEQAKVDANLVDIGTKSDTNDLELKTAKTDLQLLKNEQAVIDNSVAIVLGGLTLADIAVDTYYSPKDEERWLKAFERGLQVAQSISVKSVEMGIRSGSSDGGQAEAAQIKLMTCAMNAAFTGVRLLPRVAICIKEPDKKKQTSMISGMMADLGAAVADSIIAASTKIKTEPETDQSKIDDKEAKAQLEVIAKALKIGIAQAGNAPAIYQAYRSGDVKSLGMLLGGGAVAATFGAAGASIYDGLHKDMSEEDKLELSGFEAQFAEATGSGKDEADDKALAKALAGIDSSVQVLDATALSQLKIKSNSLEELDTEALQDQLSGAVEDQQEKEAKKELAKIVSPEQIQAMMDDVDAEMVGFEKMYDNAFPDTGITTRDPEQIAAAKTAIDRAMANTSALRQKVAMINGITSTGAGLLAALVPGTGAVVAIQKLLADIYALSKSVEIHNTWVESMEVAMASEGGSTAAIQNILVNAKIHLSKASIDVILDTLKASAEVGRMFDPTGAATATSAGASMASAVVKYGYEMQKEVAIQMGWAAYKSARDNPKNRKAARKALRLNSTLAKCCIAYGASIQGDMAAKQAIKATGLTIAALQDDKDICRRLIAYLENELADDPVVLMVDYKKDNKWIPGTPMLTLASWSKFKSACHKSAEPPLSDASLGTPGIDRLLATLEGMDDWKNTAKFDDARKKPAPDQDNDQDLPAKHTDLAKNLKDAAGYLERLEAGFSAYAPIGDNGLPHDGMAPVVKTFAALARSAQKGTKENMRLLQQFPEAVA